MTQFFGRGAHPLEAEEVRPFGGAILLGAVAPRSRGQQVAHAQQPQSGILHRLAQGGTPRAAPQQELHVGLPGGQPHIARQDIAQLGVTLAVLHMQGAALGRGGADV